MSQNKDKEKNISSDLEESNKNEEDLLAFSSKYKTNIYKEEDNKKSEMNLSNVRKRLSGDSTSISQEYSNISGHNNKKMNASQKEEQITHRSIGFSDSKKYIEYQEKQRKMSSPLCCYYDGSDIYLSKTQKTTIDIDHSPNFVRKDSFFNNNDNNNLYFNLLFKSKRKYLSSKSNNKIEYNKIESNNNDMKRLSLNINQMQFNNMNNFNRIQNNNNIMNNNFYFPNSNYPQQMSNINYLNFNNFQNIPINNNINRRKLTYNIEDGFIGNYFNNILNLNNATNSREQLFNIPQPQAKLNPILFSYNEEHEKFTKYDINRNLSNKSIPNNQKNDKKPFDKRKGDWLCPECRNLNFAFRIVCNRCQIPKPNNLGNENSH